MHPLRLIRQHGNGDEFVKRVLCFGKDEVLLRTRGWVLEKCVRVALAEQWADLTKQLQLSHFELLVICHSVDEMESQAAINAIKMHSGDAKVLRLLATGHTRENGVTRTLASAGPTEMLTAVNEMLCDQPV